MKKNVILGSVKDYDYSKLEPFIRTLKNTGYNGDFVLFHQGMSSKTLKRLKNDGIILEELGIRSHEHTMLSGDIKKVDYDLLSHMSYRFIRYLEFLEKNKNKYRNVFLSDVRDVVFQKDPFDFKIGKNVCFFMFGNSDFIMNEGYSQDVSNAYGKKMLEKLKENDLSCAGTIIGESGEMLKYLKLMKKHIYNANDQLIHNVLLYNGEIRNRKIFGNGNVVATVGDDKSMDFVEIKNNAVYNKKKQIINTIHCYDRHKILTDIFKGNSKNGFLWKVKRILWIRKVGNIIKSRLVNMPFIGGWFRRFYARIL